MYEKLIFFIMKIFEWLEIDCKPTSITEFKLWKGQKTNDMLKTKNRTWQRELSLTLNKIYLKELKIRKFLNELWIKIKNVFL